MPTNPPTPSPAPASGAETRPCRNCGQQKHEHQYYIWGWKCRASRFVGEDDSDKQYFRSSSAGDSAAPTPESPREAGRELDDETFLSLWEIRARTIGEHGTTPILAPALRRLLFLASPKHQPAVCDICDAEMTAGGLCPKCSFAAAPTTEGPREETATDQGWTKKGQPQAPQTTGRH